MLVLGCPVPPQDDPELNGTSTYTVMELSPSDSLITLYSTKILIGIDQVLFVTPSLCRNSAMFHLQASDDATQHGTNCSSCVWILFWSGGY